MKKYGILMLVCAAISTGPVRAADESPRGGDSAYADPRYPYYGKWSDGGDLLMKAFMEAFKTKGRGIGAVVLMTIAYSMTKASSEQIAKSGITALGKFMSEFFKGYSRSIGRAWKADTGLAPFGMMELREWAREIAKMLEPIEARALDARKEFTAGRGDAAMIRALPQALPGGSAIAASSQEVVLTEEEDLWQSITAVYAADIDRICLRLTALKTYYVAEAKVPTSEALDINGLVEGLVEHLQTLKSKIFLRTKTLRDMARVEKRPAFSLLQKNIANKFVGLEQWVSRYHGFISDDTSRPGSPAKESSGYGSMGF